MWVMTTDGEMVNLNYAHGIGRKHVGSYVLIEATTDKGRKTLASIGAGEHQDRQAQICLNILQNALRQKGELCSLAAERHTRLSVDDTPVPEGPTREDSAPGKPLLPGADSRFVFAKIA